MNISTYESQIKALEAGGGGGGGDSDYRTATVTFVNNTQETGVNIRIPVLYDGAIDTGFTVSFNSTQVREVILYQGLSGPGTATDFNDDYLETASVTGDIEYDEGSFNVSGEGTITF